MSEKIKLVLMRDRVMTFSADDYLRLRKQHRIVGKLIGVAPPYPRNLNLTHLPAIFTEYETRLMLEENIAVIEEKSYVPTEQMKRDFEKHQQRVSEELVNPYIESKLKLVKANMANIIKGKRKKLIQSGAREEGRP
jgi:16S rRNA G966 N2-methylase RsmD